jgi:hypothetical protein
MVSRKQQLRYLKNCLHRWNTGIGPVVPMAAFQARTKNQCKLNVNGYSEKESIRLADQAGTPCDTSLKRRRHQAMTNLQLSPQAIVELTAEQRRIAPKTYFVHRIY